jgi:hypothetical protein
VTPDQLLLAAGVALPVAYGISHLHRRVETEPIPPAVGRRGPFYSLLHPMREPLALGNVTVDFYEMHLGILAMSGGFKTTLMAQLFRQRIGKRPVVVLTGGDSDQLETEVRAAGGWVIRPHASPLTFNAFEGSPTFMAQGWAGLFPTNSEAKVYHSAFEIACIRYFESRSHYNVHDLKQFVLAYEPPDDTGSKLWKGMKEGYVGIRLELMEMAFGDWIGDQLSILDCIRRGIPIMFVVDSADDPDLNRFAAALVWQGINYAVREVGGFDVIVDELGRLPQDLIGDHVRTWRRNKCHLIAGTHSDEDFTEIIGDLIHIWCLGRMVASATKTRKEAHEMTWQQIPAMNFGAHALGKQRTVIHDLLKRPREGYFYVVDLERVQQVAVPSYSPPRIVKPRWSMRHLNATAKHVSPPLHAAAHGKDGQFPKAVSPNVVVGTAESTAQEERMHGPPEMPIAYGTKRLEDFWLRHRFPYGALDERACWRVDLALKGKGQRPGLQYEGRDWTAYDLVLALNEIVENGMDEEEARAYLSYVKLHLKTGQLSADHLCEAWRGTEAKLCVRRSHLDWEDKLVNSELHWTRLRERRATKVA